MAKKEAQKKAVRQVAPEDPTIDDSVEGHVNLQPQNIEEKPNKAAARSERRH